MYKYILLMFAGAFIFLPEISLFAEDTANNVFGVDRVEDADELNNGGGDLVGSINNILGYLIGLFYFIAVAFGVYAGFRILTSAGDEETIKKGKNTLIYVVIGLVVIFLASSIVRWIITLLDDSSGIVI